MSKANTNDPTQTAKPKSPAAKRVDIIKLKMVKEASLLYKARIIQSPTDAVKILQELSEDSDREMFIIICLNTKNEPTAIHTVSIGSLNASIVNPREVFKVAILANSASIILSHNHPSGDPTPSTEDIDVTKRLSESGKLLGIDVLDHIIIGGNGNYLSLKEKGLM